jgi:hypothetical protein
LFGAQVPLSNTYGSVNGILAHPKYQTKIFIFTFYQVIYPAEQLPLLYVSINFNGSTR